MDIHVDPPRHRDAQDICYRAIATGQCPLSHDYPLRPITRDEEAQLAWIKSLLPGDARPVSHVGETDMLSAFCRDVGIYLHHVPATKWGEGVIAVYFGLGNPLSLHKSPSAAIEEARTLVAQYPQVAVWIEVSD